MASLTGTQINNTYPSLLKTTDNTAIGGSQVNITDGEGNATPLSMSSSTLQVSAANIELVESTGGNNVINIDATKINFEGAVDFTYATVTGVGGGAAGLVAGTNTDAMRSSDDLTTTPAVASGAASIALGNSITASGGSSIVIGRNSNGTTSDAIYIGTFGSTTGSKSIGMGNSAGAAGATSIALGRLAQTSAGTNNGIAIGNTAKSRATNCITIGFNSLVDDAVRVDTVCLGANTKAAQYSTALGAGAYAVGDYAISIGDASTYGSGAIAIGDQAESFNNGAVALGRNLTAVAWNDSTTVNQLAFANVANLNFVDQAAAVAGGVPTGGLYHTDGTVKIVY